MLFFWVVTPCGIGVSPEDGDDIFLRNVGIYQRTTRRHNPEEHYRHFGVLFLDQGYELNDNIGTIVGLTLFPAVYICILKRMYVV
jgi:hypothetical protein